MVGAVIDGKMENGSPMAGPWIAGVETQRSMAENALVNQANGALMGRHWMEIAE